MTIQQHASFDSSAAELNATSKLVKAWESKNAKNAAKAGGVSLMALSLAACGGSSTPVVVADDAAADPVVPVVVTPISAALTTGTDSVTGTTGADTVSGARIDAVQTLNSGDSIALGAGTDSLSANINTDVTPTLISGVETITISSVGSAAATLDMDNVSGATTLVNNGSTQGMTFDDIQAVATTSVSNTAAATTFTFKTAVLSGTTDTVNLNLDAATGTITIGSEADPGGDIETMTINATGGASTFATGEIVFGTDATSITVTGTAALTMNVDEEFANVNTFDASAATGAVSVQFADRPTVGEDVIAFTGGAGADDFDVTSIVAADVSTRTIDMKAGNDTLTVDLAQHDTSFSADGGAGTDALELGTNTAITTAAILAKFSNFEELTIGAGRTVSQDMDFSVSNTVNTVGATSVTLTDVAATGTIVNVKQGTTGTLDVSDLKANGAADSITVNLGGTAAAILSTFTASSNYETITLNSVGSAANTLTGLGAAVNNLSVNATTALTISSTANISGVLGAGTSTAAITVSDTATTAQTITLGSGDDTVSDTGNTATTVVQIFNLGAGDDTITTGAVAGGITIDAGAGSDTINAAAALADNTAAGVDVVSITGGAGHDFITTSTGDSDEQIVITATNSDDADYVIGFDGTGTDVIDYNGSVTNGGTTTVQTAAIGATTSLNADIAAVIASDTNDTVYLIGQNLTGAAATDLTQIVAAAVANETTTFATEIASFESTLAAAIGTVTNLDTHLGTTDAVLFQFDQGTDSIVVRVTNSDTTVANTLTAAEIEVVLVSDSDILVAGDYI